MAIEYTSGDYYDKKTGKLPEEILSQEFLKSAIKDLPTNKYIKDLPVSFYKYSDLTDELKEQVGSVDGATYENSLEGEIIACQIKKDGNIDLYPVDKDLIKETYVPTDGLAFDIEGKKPVLNGIKKIPVEMVKLEDILKNTKDDFKATIEAPWGGTQQIDENYLIVKGNETYGVEIDEKTGNPIGYIPA